MRIWAIADLHLSFGVKDKKMDVFGDQWINHDEKIAEEWRKVIAEDDLVLLAGDISWAMRLEDVQPDLDWIHALPGTKVMIRGNHDYWWHSLSKITKILPPSIHVIQNNAFHWKNVGVAGARLWDTSEYNFDDYVVMKPNPKANPLTAVDTNPENTQHIFERELHRLEASLKCFNANDTVRIVMTHYPPINATLQQSLTSALLEKYGVKYCVFGHIHNVPHDKDPLFGTKNGIEYSLTACDYLDFKPLLILSS